ncbi:MAG: type III secretion system chaperone [Puniceicoccales bacterium]|jgi:hypothetical protein|nr:type III secretion system chaperone [Puniceicoccales bacterium]
MDVLSLHEELTDKFSNMFLFDNIFNIYRFQAENDMFQFEILSDGVYSTDPTVFVSSLLCPVDFGEEHDALEKLAKALAMNMYFIQTNGASIGFEPDTLQLAVFENVALNKLQSAEDLIEWLTKFTNKFAGIRDTFFQVQEA